MPIDEEKVSIMNFPTAEAAEFELVVSPNNESGVIESLKKRVEGVRNRIRSIGKSSVVGGTVVKVRAIIDKLGIPGLLLYNVFDGLSRGVPVYFIVDGTQEESLTTACVVGGVAIITNVTFWTAMGLIALKVKSVISDKRGEVLIPEAELNPELESGNSDKSRAEDDFDI